MPNDVGDANTYAMIQITNRTARAQAIALSVQALDANGSWDPVPEKLVLKPGIANVMFVLPARSSTNLSVKWLPWFPQRGGNNWRVLGEYDPVASRLEGWLVQWANRLKLAYPFLAGGRISAQEIGAPNQTVQQTGASHPVQQSARSSGSVGSGR